MTDADGGSAWLIVLARDHTACREHCAPWHENDGNENPQAQLCIWDLVFFFFSSGPWQVSVTHTKHWISQCTSRQGFVFKSIQQALGAVAIETLPEPLFFGVVFSICLMIGMSCIWASLAELLCSLDPGLGLFTHPNSEEV